MKKELIVFTVAALVFVTPVAASNSNHNQNNNNSNHGNQNSSFGRFGGRLVDNHSRGGFDNQQHPYQSSTPSATPVATPPITSQQNDPHHGGFDCSRLIGRFFNNFNFFHHHN